MNRRMLLIRALLLMFSAAVFLWIGIDKERGDCNPDCPVSGTLYMVIGIVFLVLAIVRLFAYRAAPPDPRP